MIERAVAFAPGSRLAGVLCDPDPETALAGAPTVLTWNVGVNHHAGPYRFFVDLARALSKIGVSSLRFDLSGLGDSAARTDATLELERARQDVGEAMTFLERHHGRRRFVLVGFCSGVDAAHGIAVRDARVEGVCFIEGYAFRTPGFFARYPLRYLSGARWRRLLARRIPSFARGLPLLGELRRLSGDFSKEDMVFVREHPPRETLRRDYGAMSARGTRQLSVYMGGDSHYNHESQFLEFAGMSSLPATTKIVYLPHADHTLFRVADRERVVELTAAWVAQGAPRARGEDSPPKRDARVHEAVRHGEPPAEARARCQAAELRAKLRGEDR